MPDPPAELSPQPASRVAPAALRTIVVERVEGREPPAAPEAETQTVVVSIGRIEVNAERPAPLPAPAASTGWAGPRLSLDDYLWERNGGGGR